MTEFEVEMRNAQGMCPHCECESITYGSLQEGDNCVFYPATCDRCGTTWEETYELDYIGNHNIQETQEEE